MLPRMFGRHPARARRLGRCLPLAVLLVHGLVVGCASTQVAPAADDDWISAEVWRRLGQDRRVDAAEMAVDTRDGVVVVSGIAASTREVRRALQIAADVRGVRQVVNRLRVLPTSGASHLLQAARAS